jgi:glucose-6-phosphate 1-epimerase
MNVEQLNTEFGIAGQLKFVEGKGGLPLIEIDNGKAAATISVYAGQVLSYRPANEPIDLLFLSGKAYYADGKAIKGGVPVCWPWFGPDPEGRGRPGHGFVRNRMWSVRGTEAMNDGSTRVRLGLSATDETRAIWPQSFALTLEITIGDTLGLAMTTNNSGDQPFSITQAFHTYFLVGDIDSVRVLGLENTRYIDKVDNSAGKTQTGAVAITQEVDRIYLDVPTELVLDDAALRRRIHITSGGSRTAVVWNPWAKISAEMADLEDDDYKRLLCIETTNAANDVIVVAPGDACQLAALYRMERY